MKILSLVGLVLIAMPIEVRAYDTDCTSRYGCVSIVATTPEERAADERRRAEERARKEAEIRSLGLPPHRRAEAERLLEMQRAAAAARGEHALSSAPSKPETTADIPTAPPRDCKWYPKKEGHFRGANTELEARARLDQMRAPYCLRGAPSQITPVTCHKNVGLDAINSKGRRIRGTADVSFVCQYSWVCAQGIERCSGASGASRQ